MHAFPERRGALAAALLGTAVFITVVLVARLPLNSSGPPLAAGWMLSAAVVVGGLCLAGVHFFITAEPVTAPLRVRLLAALFSSAIACLATVTAASQGTTLTFVCGCLLALLLLTSSLALAVLDDLPWRALLGSLAARFRAAPLEPIQAEESVGATLVAASDEDESAALPEGVDQSWRRWGMEGKDILDGCVRVHFEPGQATAIVHIPLQPAMMTTPHVDVEPVDDCDLRISADPVLPYGVRLTCRRSGELETALSTAVAVQISAAQARAKAA